MTRLVQYLHSIHPLSPDLRDHLFRVLKSTELKKKDRLLKAGEVCRQIYFVEQGLFRCSYVEHFKEVCVWFMKEDDVIVSVSSFFPQEPSYQSIHAMENSRVYSITYDELQQIYYRFPEFNYIGRVLTEKYYYLSEERHYLLRMKTASERYDHFVRRYPDFLERLPATHIASYLGIALETLIRIKNKKQKSDLDQAKK